MEGDDRPRAADVGLTDRRRDGWLNGGSGELAPGVPVRAADTVIDVGCGDGSFIHFCARQGAEVVFIDRDAARLARTRSKIASSPARSHRGILSDCDPIPLEDAAGDLVICTEVLEHVPDPGGFMAELRRITRPGGRLLITVPDARSEHLVAASAPPQYFQEPNHIRVFTGEALRQLVSDAGLTIESHQFLGCFWSLYWPLSWLTCAPDSGLPVDNAHPITDHWTRLWLEVQNHPRGHRVREALNAVLPKAQTIVARNPA